VAGNAAFVNEAARREGKWLLKKAMAPMLPSEILYRKKMDLQFARVLFRAR